MELSTFQRYVSFTAIVIVLAGLAVYLFLPSASGAGGSPGPAAHGASPTPGGASRTPSRGPGSSPGPSVPPGSGRAPDIYQWLPFTQTDLASAAEVTVRFGDDYGTYSYTESAASYLTPMRSLVTAQLGQLIGRAYATPGVVADRMSRKQTSAASTSILSLRAFGPTSLTFVVAITERTSTSTSGGNGGGRGNGGGSQQVLDYAVTLTGSGTTWQVSDIEPASAGNQ